MIGYVTLGAKDLDKAAQYYDALLGEIGAKRFMDNDRIKFWAVSPKAPMLAVCKPFDGADAGCGNGVMVALAVNSRDQVDALHAKALELGGTDEGAPGERMPGFYGGYFRDLDGNKLNFFAMGAG